MKAPKQRNLWFVFRYSVYFGAFLFALLFLSSCELFPKVEVPDQLTLNGYIITNQNTVQFNLSALKEGNVITSGQVSSVGVSVKTPGYTGSASVCGQIVVQQQVTAAITLDATGSMGWTDPNRLRNQAAKAFVDRLSSQDRAAVASFETYRTPTTGFRAVTLWQNLTSDKQLLKAAVDKATYEGGGTNLWDAVADSVDIVKGFNNPVALVLTDGEDNSSALNYLDAANYAKDKKVKVYMVGLGKTLAYAQMQEVARITGGTFADAADASQLTTLFDGIFNAIRGSFCVQVVFSPTPSSGTTISGVLQPVVNGARFDVPFDVKFY